MHFEQMAAEYAGARPLYPEVVFQTLEAEGVVGPGIRVLEVGAGSGLATRELVARGCEVVAVEPGRQLASFIEAAGLGVEVLTSRLEDVQLAEADFDAIVAATAMHWIDLSVGLPLVHRALRPGGVLAVFRTVFGDDTVRTPFRGRVDDIVAKRPRTEEGRHREERPTMAELAADGWFEPVRTARWRWSIDLSAAQIGALFRTFSNWTAGEAAAAEAAASDLGGQVTEHYQTVLHLLRRAPRPT